MSFDQQQQQQQQGGGKGGVVVRDEASCVVQASSGDSGSTLKAHDYIGLSEVTSMPPLKVEKNDNKALPDLNLGETELRLGPPKSPPPGAAAGSGAGQGASVAAQLKDAAIASKNQGLVADAPSQQQKWHEKLASGGSGNAVNMYPQQKQKQSSQEHNGDKNHEKNEQQQVQQQQQQHEMNAYSHAVAAAMAAQKNNNNNTVAGAKRGFSEAIGNGFVEGRSVMPSIGASGASAASQNGKNPLMPSMYPWSASKQLPVAWRMGLEQSKGSFGPFPSSQPNMQQQQNKDASRENTPQNAWDSSSAPASKTSNGGFGLSSSSAQKNKEEDTSDEIAPSPPVVGWPPVQSFRKNTLAAHPPPPQKSTATTEVKASATVASVPAAAPSSASAAPTASNIPLFVKVYMDGVPIGRKVDLKAHNSYEKLSSVLEEMFHRFITGQNGAEVSSLSDPGMSSESKKLNFLHGSEFVLTYEDKDGDLMLVGDVPWGMFTGTVKRLRIMKGSEAIGLAPPQAAAAAADKKVACQA